MPTERIIVNRVPLLTNADEPARTPDYDAATWGDTGQPLSFDEIEACKKADSGRNTAEFRGTCHVISFMPKDGSCVVRNAVIPYRLANLKT